jgi:hypothetical protein
LNANFNDDQTNTPLKTLHALTTVIGASVILMALSCQRPASKEESGSEPTAANTLTEEEKTAGWQLLFDGSTLTGWKRYNRDTIGPLWTVQDGAIVCNGEGLGEGTANVGGSLLTTRQFGNFDLSVDWKITPGGNSGILYHVVEKPEFKHDYETGPEYQVMDDAGWKGDSLRAEQMAGGNYDMYAADTGKKLKPVGEWNTARIVYNNGHVEHWLNGEKVVEFEESSEDFKQRYQKSKWTGYPGWNQFKTGAISLQDHGAPVYYRNIKIKEL